MQQQTNSNLASCIPYKLNMQSQLQWLYVSDKKFTEPFFTETIAYCKQFPENPFRYRSTSSCEMLAEWSNQIDAVKPTAIIFHVSRCGSTLLSQLLSLDDSHIVLSEVPLFDELLRSRFKNDAADLSSLLPHAISFYAQKRTGTEKQLFIKTDSWHLFFYEQIRAIYPDVPMILLYRRPDEVISSQEKLKGMHAVAGVIEQEIFNLGTLPLFHLSPNAYMAAVLEQYYKQMQLIIANDSNAHLLNYNEGFNNIIEKVYKIIAAPLTDELKHQVAERCRFNAKYPTQSFTAPLDTIDPAGQYMTNAFIEYEILDQLRSSSTK